jgi:hypothetical protein
MRLDELIGVKKLQDEDLKGIISHMQKSGFKELGRGAFGAAFKHPIKPGVIKFWVKDSSYDSFIDYIQKHPSKYFPKLLSKPKELSSFFLRPKHFPDKVKYVRMEELKPIENHKILSSLSALLSRLTDPDADYEEIEKWAYGEKSNFTDMVDDFKDFYEVVQKMVMKLCSSGENKIDIEYSNNVMQRNGTIVFTDPIFNEHDLEDADFVSNLITDLEAGKDDIETIKGRSKK